MIFASKEDHAIPSTVELPVAEAQPGLLLPSGEINWNCPCLGGMATGPCGVEFREAFSCFHYSEAETKGADCYEAFKTMQDCMAEYPTVYKQNEEDSMNLDLDNMEEESERGSKKHEAPAVEYAEPDEDVGKQKAEVAAN